MRLTLPAVAALLSAITVTAQVQSPSAEAGRITGHVVTGYAELVADATVTLLGSANDQGLRRTTKTDSTGSFSFAGLPAGSYRLSATKPGYTSRQITDGGARSLAALEIGPAVDSQRMHMRMSKSSFAEPPASPAASSALTAVPLRTPLSVLCRAPPTSKQ